jgi:LysM repeat protein
LGNAYVAEAGDPYALYYNPGGLSEINQKEVLFDYGRSSSIGEPTRSDFNGMLAMPYRFKETYVPLAFGLYGDAPAPGAHIIDFTAGGATDAPVERWTRGIVTLPAKLGVALTVRHQKGDEKSSHVGESTLALGLTGGFFIPWDRNHQFGIAIRDLYMGDGDPRGASINVGAYRHHKGILNMYGEIEYARGGVWRVKPGLEWLFARGVVRPRLGWGYRDSGGIDLLATGIGFYISPFQMDITYSIPLKTLNDDAHQFRTSLSYRFGKPQFTEIYYDRALEAASQLDQQVLGMTVKEAELKASLAELEQKNRLAKEELDNMKSRIEILKTQDVLGDRDRKIKNLQKRVYSLETQLKREKATVKSIRQKKATVRTHTVAAGETLQSISKKYYGDPNQWKKIYNRNPDKVERGLPQVGATLVIP